MKWQSKTKPVKIAPKLGDTKECIRFAIFPVKVQDKWVWWEKYILVKTYQEYYYEMDHVVSQGILTEKYYTTTEKGEAWRRTDRKFYPGKEQENVRS